MGPAVSCRFLFLWLSFKIHSFTDKYLKVHFFFNFSEGIPEEFHSDQNNQPHQECSVCGNGFGDDYYFIEKAYQKTYDNASFEMTFEYAICERCKKDMMQSISKESMKNIQDFAMKMGGMPVPENSDNVEVNLRQYLTTCIATGKPIEELQEYHLVGIFKGDKMVQLPMLYGETFIEEYSELLSEETKGFFDDFFNNITLLPPTLAKILEDEKPRRPVLV